MIDHPNRHLVLSGAHNLRDLGGYATGAGSTTQWRRLLRSAAPHRLTEESRERLVGDGLKTVIDLRSDSEIKAQPSIFAKDPSVAYVHLPLYEVLGPPKMAAPGATPFDMGTRYCEAFGACGTAIRLALVTIAEADEGMVLFNCTAGKDRTGIIAALLLSIAGVDEATIIADYALTASVGSVMLAELLEAAMARGGDRDHTLRVLASEPASMRTALAFLADRYGGVTGYLEEIGVHAGIRQRLAERLTSELPADRRLEPSAA